MKPLNLIALLLFLTGAIWALTRSERTVRSIQTAYYSALSPFLKQGSNLENSARAFVSETRNSRSLETELKATREQVSRLRLIESRFLVLERENAQLRHALNFKKTTNFKLVAANVIRRNPTTWWQTVEIDAGEEQGIGVQLTVLNNQGLVGKIDRVDAHDDRSSVLLLTDEKCLVSARVEGSPEVGILSGQRGGSNGDPMLRLKYLSPNANLSKGQRVFTTGRGGIFPANILLGTIESVKKGALESEAFVRPSVNFADLSTVFVILDNDSTAKK